MASDQTTAAPVPAIAMASAWPSNALDAFGYDAASRTLRIAFPSGAVYDYAGVTPEEATALQISRTKGSYVRQFIQGKHPETMVKAKNPKPSAPPAAEPDFLAGVQACSARPGDGECESCQ